MADLTLNGTKGLELTREEAIDLGFRSLHLFARLNAER